MATKSSTPTRQDLADMSKDELMQHAQRLDIDGRSSMNKDELIKAISSSGSSSSRGGNSAKGGSDSSDRDRDENGQFKSARN